jgi:lipoprotein-releasing system permease protein
MDYDLSEYLLLAFLLLVFPFISVLLAYLLTRQVLSRVLGLLAGKVPVYLAGRYLFSRQNRGAINIITFISVVGVTYVTYSLIVILSIFNGFQHYIENRYTAFDPDLRIVAARGKSFASPDSLVEVIRGVEGVKAMSPVIEDKAMLTYFDKQYMTVVKGLRSDYLAVNPLDTLIYEGEYAFETDEGFPATVLGGTVAYYINSRISDRMHPMKLWAAGDARNFLRNPEEAIVTKELFANAYFKVQLEYDGRYILTSYRLAQELFQLQGRATAIEVHVTDFDAAADVAAAIQAKIGPQYRVETWYEMHAALFNVMKNEKFVAYLILSLMLLIAAVNIIGGLSMIIVEKTRDIGILRSMGAHPSVIGRIFTVEGVFTGMIGGIAGMLSAGLFSYLQIHYGILRINGGESFQDILYFPLQAYWSDYLLTFATVFVLSTLAGIYPSRRAAKTNIIQALRK